MFNLESFVGKKVNIVCTDGKTYSNYYVYSFTDAYDNYEPDEDSIDITIDSDSSGGITLYRSEIKSIETA